MDSTSTRRNEPHDVPLTLRFRASDYTELKHAANRDHRRVSDWARARVLAALNDSVLDRVESRAS